MKNTIRSSAITTALGLLVSALVTPASAQSAVQLDIQNVVVSYTSAGDPDTMTVTGVNFGAVTGLVTLNGFDQTVTTWTPSQIVAQVSGVGDPGTYQLDVRRADAQGQAFRDQADVAIGATGPRGPAGPDGPQGASGVLGYEIISENFEIVVSPGSSRWAYAGCPLGKKVLGGGCNVQFGAGGAPLALRDSISLDYAGWFCEWTNSGAQEATATVTARAICATVH